MLRGLGSKVILVLLTLISAVTGAAAQSRIALVIGNSAYQNARPLATVTGDATIVAETMRTAGYDVIEARDVRLADIGLVMREFLDKVVAAGPQAVAYVYFAGYAAQSQGENFLVPVDASINNDGEVQYQALRVNDLVRELSALPDRSEITPPDIKVADHQRHQHHREGVERISHEAEWNAVALGNARDG